VESSSRLLLRVRGNTSKCSVLSVLIDTRTIYELSVTHRVLYAGKCTYVLGRIVSQNRKISSITSGNLAELFGCSETLNGSGGQRRQDLGVAHSGLGHEHILLRRIIVCHVANIRTEEDHASSPEPCLQLADSSFLKPIRN